jgi:hypothetical protein
MLLVECSRTPLEVAYQASQPAGTTFSHAITAKEGEITFPLITFPEEKISRSVEYDHARIKCTLNGAQIRETDSWGKSINTKASRKHFSAPVYLGWAASFIINSLICWGKSPRRGPPSDCVAISNANPFPMVNPLWAASDNCEQTVQGQKPATLQFAREASLFSNYFVLIESLNFSFSSSLKPSNKQEISVNIYEPLAPSPSVHPPNATDLRARCKLKSRLDWLPFSAILFDSFLAFAFPLRRQKPPSERLLNLSKNESHK